MVKVYGKDGKPICYWPPYTEEELRLFDFISKPPITVIRQAPAGPPETNPAVEEQPPAPPLSASRKRSTEPGP